MNPTAQESCARCGRRSPVAGSEFCSVCQDEIELDRMRSRFKPSQSGEATPPASKESASSGPGLLQRGLQRLGLGRSGSKPERPHEPAPQPRNQNLCGVDLGDGQLCGRPARRYDKERAIPVCDDHTVWWCPACRQSHTRSQVKQVERSDRAIFVCRETLVAVE